MSTPYADYDPFARMYNLHWGGQSDRHLDLLESHVLSRLPPAANVLDLCCGTGQLAQVLTEKGHAVLGIDGSEHMLSFARTNASTAQFILGDARDFRVREPLDAVLCLFDSLNHLMTESELSKAFASVARALRPGGLFAFDLNMEAKYLNTWAGEFSIVGDHEVAIVHASVEDSARRAMFDATLFYDDGKGCWSRDEVHLVQTWYDEEAVRLLLGEAGFEAPTTHIKQALPEDPETAQNLLFITARSPP